MSSLFNLTELTGLAETYNIVVRPHPTYLQRAVAQPVLNKLRALESGSFHVDGETDPAQRLADAGVRFPTKGPPLTARLLLGDLVQDFENVCLLSWLLRIE